MLKLWATSQKYTTIDHYKLNNAPLSHMSQKTVTTVTISKYLASVFSVHEQFREIKLHVLGALGFGQCS